MLPQWIIEKKRDGLVLTEKELSFFIDGYAGGAIPDYQMAALAMAIVIRGMTKEEIVALTRSMWQSGITLERTDLPGARIDKHSTGGIGDKISLALVPLVAVCGVIVPMIAGRGLGITGGTIDKLESIPGFKTQIAPAALAGILQKCGCAIVSQTDQIAPADRKLYALRDVTGTVHSIPLIVASILSKKLAANLDGLVLDVKWGKGAFMGALPEAENLARTLVETAGLLRLKARALITDMNCPLGRSAGNALEVREILELLHGRGAPDLTALTLELAARMLVMGKAASDHAQAMQRARDALMSGAALDRLMLMVRLQGGDARVLEQPKLLPAARICRSLPAKRGGFVVAVDARAVGRAALLLGAGRSRVTDVVDYAAGIAELKQAGEPVAAGEALCVLHAADESRIDAARVQLEDAFEIADQPQQPQPLIAAEI